MFWRTPAFTCVAVLTLMAGIAANVVMFGVVEAVLRPLDVAEPRNFYQVRNGVWTNWKLLTTSYPAFREYQQRNTTFSGLAGYYGYCEARLHGAGESKAINGYAVTGNYFDLLGVQPELGRLIHSDDEHGPGSAPFVVLSDSLWRSAFKADPKVIGSIIRLNKDQFTVIGITPARFHGTERFVWPDYYIPLLNYFSATYLNDRSGYGLTVLGRLKGGTTRWQAAENLSAISAAQAKEHPQTDAGLPVRLVRPGLYADTGDVIRSSLYAVMGLSLLVLAAASANLAALFAARAADRGRELAIRLAVGASRWRLVRQLLTEALLVAVIGGAAGLGCAGYLLKAISRSSLAAFFPVNSPLTGAPIVLNATSYLVALVFTVLSALFFGIIPARQIWRSSETPGSGAAVASDLPRFSARDLLLGIQIAICALMVTASLVAVRGMWRTLHAPLGFQPKGATLTEIDLTDAEANGEASLVQKKAMINALQSIPGVTSAGSLSKPFFTGGRRGTPVFAPGTTELTLKKSLLSALTFAISPEYLAVARTRLLRGRDFSWRDTMGTPDVVIVNETFARKMWGDTPAIGRRFIFLNKLREVTGVVEDGKYLEMQEPPQPVVFLPLAQDEHANTAFIVRSQRPLSEMGPLIEHALLSVEPNAVVTSQDWYAALAWPLFPVRAAAVAIGTMAALASMVAVTGIFGMAAYNVSRRMKELGIRVALGARLRHVLSTAVGKPLALLGAGSVVGVMWAIFARSWLGEIVHEPNPADPLVMLGAVLTMTLLGVAASTLPALRAVAVDPSKLLREDA
ncbi:MAG: ABC transporter permease [Verrucomicrobia bacterium]|nr:ABC transporter permease [Verrucomicrobiota bacterium]